MSTGPDPHRSQVVVKVLGGLGNQLFCYATARALASRVDADLVLDVDFFRSDVRYERAYRLDRFALAPHRLKRTARRLPRSLDLRWWRVKRALIERGLVPGVTAVIERDAKAFHAELLTRDVAGALLLDGYWQDERYFAGIRQQLLDELVPIGPIDPRHAALAATMRATQSVAVHCRRHHHRLADGTVQAARGRSGLDVQYYRLAMEQLTATARPDHLYLFGDDPAWLASALQTSIPRTVIDWNAGPGGEVLDLWLMTQCRHSVVSNSTLSWWGAWLGVDPVRQVIAPRPQDLEYWVASAQGWREIGW
jgi:hypothetical protein